MLKMKNLLIMFAIVFFLSMLTLMILVTRNDDTVKVESRKFINHIMPVILKDLNKDTFLKYATPEFLNKVDENQVEKVFNIYKKLGNFKKLVSLKGKVKTSLSFIEGKVVYAKYDVKALFTTGEAVAKVTIIRHDGEWYIYHLKINSKVFNELEKKD